MIHVNLCLFLESRAMFLALMKLEDRRVTKKRRRMYSILNNDTKKTKVSSRSEVMVFTEKVRFYNWTCPEAGGGGGRSGSFMLNVIVKCLNH